MIESLKKDLAKHARPDKVDIYQNFFKTGPGQYGEGDVFIGVTVPNTRSVAKKYYAMKLSDVKKLMASPIHEERLAAILILVHKYQKGTEQEKKQVYDFYWQNAKGVNNWDLVDLSAHKIVGDYLLDKDKAILYKLAKSSNLWERRIAIIATFAFINKNRFDDSLKLAEILLNDKHDLIHKAVGWMLREIGKKDQAVEEKFLDKHYKHMPRTMLRYSIERFEDKKRKHYMTKPVP
ncbi:DNA alkylation repair protein [Nanoarchaeota archaeon]